MKCINKLKRNSISTQKFCFFLLLYMQIYIPLIKIISIIEVKKIWNSVGNFLSKEKDELSIDSEIKRLARFKGFKKEDIAYIVDTTKELFESNDVIIRTSEFGFAIMIKKETDVLPKLKIDDENAQKLIADTVFFIHLVIKHNETYEKIKDKKQINHIISFAKENKLFNIILSKFYRVTNTFLDADKRFITRHIIEDDIVDDVKLCEITIQYQESISKMDDVVLEFDKMQLKCFIELLKNVYGELE